MRKQAPRDGNGDSGGGSLMMDGWRRRKGTSADASRGRGRRERHGEGCGWPRCYCVSWWVVGLRQKVQEMDGVWRSGRIVGGLTCYSTVLLILCFIRDLNKVIGRQEMKGQWRSLYEGSPTGDGDSGRVEIGRYALQLQRAAPKEHP